LVASEEELLLENFTLVWTCLESVLRPHFVCYSSAVWVFCFH